MTTPTLPIELRNVKETAAQGGGFWRSCSGCHELNDGHDTGPMSQVLGCALGVGCSECGGIGAIWDATDYEEMADFMSRPGQDDEALAAQPELPEPVAHQFQDRTSEKHYEDTKGDGTWPIRTLYTAAQLQQAVEQAQAKREPMSEIALANQTSRFYPPDEMIASGIYMQAWRDAEAHHNIGDKA